MMSAHRGGYETPGGLNRVLPGPQWAQIPKVSKVLTVWGQTRSWAHSWKLGGWVGRGAAVLRRMAQPTLSRAPQWRRGSHSAQSWGAGRKSTDRDLGSGSKEGRAGASGAPRSVLAGPRGQDSLMGARLRGAMTTRLKLLPRARPRPQEAEGPLPRLVLPP